MIAVLLLAVTACTGRADRPIGYTGTEDSGTDDTDTDLGDTGPIDADGDGYTAEEDCDDTDPGVNPGAIDDCLGGIDRDCDATRLVCDVEGSDVHVYVSTPQRSVAAVPDLDGDGLPEIAANGAVDDIFLTTGADLQVGRSAENRWADPSVVIAMPDWAGIESYFAIAGGDHDGDGRGDLLANVLDYDTLSWTPRTTAYVFTGLTLSTAEALDVTDADWTVEGAEGQKVDRVFEGADLDGDGDLEMLLTGWLQYGIDPEEGYTSILDGGATSPGGAYAAEDVEYARLELPTFDAAAGDLDGDGRPDLLLTTYEQVLVYDGAGIPPNGALAAEDADAWWASPRPGQHHADIVGDVDGDGTREAAIGYLVDYADPGRVFLHAGVSLQGGVEFTDDDAFVRIDPAFPADLIFRASDGGERDGDERAEILIAAQADFSGDDHRGRLCMLYGSQIPASGTMDLTACSLGFEVGSSAWGAHSGIGHVDFDGDDQVDIGFWWGSGVDIWFAP